MKLTQRETDLENAIRSYLDVTPNVKKIPEYNPLSDPADSGKNNWSNIQAITYDGANIGENKTKIFAYIGFPDGADINNKVPAVVLVHGGGGHAFAEWVKIWNDRGYAAIAMDTTGYFPSAAFKGKSNDEIAHDDKWHFGLYGDFLQDGYVNAPNTDKMADPSLPFEKQWMYHGVIATILAHNLLIAWDSVDNDKIGITGISWGGNITSIAIGYDTRYAFAVPVYGSAYVDEAHSYMGPIFSNPGNLLLWSATKRLSNIKFPIFWMGWANDMAFSLNSNSKSYEATKDNAVLTILENWQHSHAYGWGPAEIYRFADFVIKGGAGLTTCVTEPEGKNPTFTIKRSEDTVDVTAQAYYITSPLSYSLKPGNDDTSIDQTWETIPCTVKGDTVSAELPDTAVSYYIELTAKTPDGDFITTTRFVENIK